MIGIDQSNKNGLKRVRSINKGNLPFIFHDTSIEDKNDSPTRKCPSREKTNKLINIQDSVSLELGIKKCYEWFVKNTIELKIENSE